MHDIKEKYANCPSYIQEVIDMLLNQYGIPNKELNINQLQCITNNGSFLVNTPRCDVTKTRVISFTLGEYKNEFSSPIDWADCLRKIGGFLDNKDSNKMSSLGKTNWTFSSRGKRPAITTYVTKDQREKNIYSKLGKSNVYICTNFDNNNKLEFIYKLIEEFGYSEKDLTIEVVGI